jgi:hypothetical protein
MDVSTSPSDATDGHESHAERRRRPGKIMIDGGDQRHRVRLVYPLLL